MSKTIKIDQKVMELLKVTDISRMIASTPLGPLMLQLRKGEKEYKLVLDSVPLENELNKELMELLFAKDMVPQVKKDAFKGLEDIVDNGTRTVYIPTPKNWKCKRKGCKTTVKHTHTTFDILKDKKPKNADAKAKKNS